MLESEERRAADLSLHAAETATRRGQYAAALKLYAALGERRPALWESFDRKSRLERLCGLLAESKRSGRKALRALSRAARGRRGVADFLMMAATVFESHGEPAVALDHYLRSIRLGTRHASTAILNAARLSLSLGRADRARTLVGRLLPADRRTATAFVLAGASEALTRNYSNALEELDRAVELDPRRPESRVWRGEVRRRLKDYRGAAEDLDEAAALRNGRPEPAGEALNRALLALSEGRTLSVPDYGALALHLPEDAFGRSRLTKARGLPPRQAALILEKALLRMQGNRSDIVTFTRTLRGKITLRRHQTPDGSGPGGLYPLIQRRCLLGKPDLALSEFDRLIRAGRIPARVYAYRGEVLLWMGEAAAAAADMNRSLEIGGALPWPNVGLAGAHLLMGRPREALGFLSLAARNGARPPRLWIRRGEALYRLGEFSAALADLRAASDGPAFVPSAWILRALAEGGAGDAREMRRAFVRVVASVPEFVALAASCADSPPNGAPRSWTDPEIAMVLEQALRMMRGNRSISGAHTCVTPSGEMRAIHLDDAPARSAGE